MVTIKLSTLENLTNAIINTNNLTQMEIFARYLKNFDMQLYQKLGDVIRNSGDRKAEIKFELQTCYDEESSKLLGELETIYRLNQKHR